MFYMKELPNEEDFRPLVPEYSSLDTSSVMLFYLFLQVGSDMLTVFETYLADHGVSQGRFIVFAVVAALPSQKQRVGSQPIGVGQAGRRDARDDDRVDEGTSARWDLIERFQPRWR